MSGLRRQCRRDRCASANGRSLTPSPTTMEYDSHAFAIVWAIAFAAAVAVAVAVASTLPTTFGAQQVATSIVTTETQMTPVVREA